MIFQFFSILFSPQYDIDAANAFYVHAKPIAYAVILCGILKIFAQIAFVYLAAVFALKGWMRDRQPFALKWPLRVWNAFLALLSVYGTLVTGTHLLQLLSTDGFQASYCRRGSFSEGETGRAGFVFVNSKLLELGDTVFILLKKRPLIFLHWYHHFATVLFTFHTFTTVTGFGNWAMTLNFLVHSFMYSYYTAASFGIRQIPKFVCSAITTLQIVQFVVVIFTIIHSAFLVHIQRANCDLPSEVLVSGLLMFSSYLVLFVHFFARRYGLLCMRTGKK